MARIQDKALDDAPVASRIQSFDGRPYRGCVDIITASMPCTPHSCAGAQKDIKDPRWLWDDTKRVVEETEARVVFMENVLGFKRVLPIVRAQLEALGYTVDVQIVSAAEIGATHRRLRVWLLAYSNSDAPRIQPWWSERQGRTQPAEHRRRCQRMGYPGCVGQCESHPEACPIAWSESWGTDLVSGPEMGDSDDARRRSQGHDGHAKRTAHQSGKKVGNTDLVERRCRKRRTTDVETSRRSRSRDSGEAMGDPSSTHKRRKRKSETRQVAPRGPGGGLGHSNGEQYQERESICPYTSEELETGERAIAEMGYPYGGRLPKLEECYGQQTDADREASFWRNSFGSGIPLFPPGRSEAERRQWAPVLEEDLGLCPALPKSEIRGVVDGTSGYVDQCRSVGRGLVPLAGAYAMCFMFVRAGLVY